MFVVGALALTAANLSAASGCQDSIERLSMASDTITAMINTPDKGIPEEVFSNAKCIVVIPHLVKGGFVRQKDVAQSDNTAAQADRAKAQADAATSQANMAAAQADAAKAQADMTAKQASSTAEINAANAAADQSRAAAQTAEQNEQQADKEKAVLRANLEARLNQILQTRDSARGLIINMSDVLFDSGKFSLNPGAREKLAKVAGILVSYPSLKTEVGGYTDNVGNDDGNQVLSENRANAVRDYLVHQGVATYSVNARGYGNSSPVASNDNSGGRQSNRRVELVVSGEANCA
jgi:outer membrane protein OmpA-like peptidoglycan-associated protein